MEKELRILEKVYEMILYYHCLYVKIPKAHKYNLGEKITDNLLSFYILVEQIDKDSDKKNWIKEIDLKLDIIRLLIRMAKDLRIVSLKQYDIFCDKFFEIYNMIEKWKKSF